MDEDNKVVADTSAMSNEDLKSAIKETMEKIRLQAMLLGAQSMCSVILQKITVLEHKQSKITIAKRDKNNFICNYFLLLLYSNNFTCFSSFFSDFVFI